MKAIDEVGIRKTIRFLVYSGFQVAYHNLIDHLLYFSHTRKLFLSALGAKIGPNSIMMNVHFVNWHHAGPGGFTVGKDCFIGDETTIDLYDSVTLEDQVTLAQRVTVLTHLNVGYKDHPLQKFFPKSSKPVLFKKGCVVATGAIVLPGVTISEKSFVAAGSVVTKNVPPQTLIAGIPAKVIRKIS